MNKQSLSLSHLQASTSWIDFKHFENLIFKSNDIKIKGVKETHSRKLFKFGLHHARENLTADQVIFNLSDKHLTTDEKEVLSHGLKFALPPKKLNYHHFLNFEKLYNELRENIIYDQLQDGLHRVKTTIKNIAFQSYYKFMNFRFHHNFKYIKTLKALSKDNSIVILKPDKGNGIVIMNKIDYISKMESIVGDTSKFKIINEDIFKVTIRHEDKINRFLSKLHKEGLLDHVTYCDLHLSSSRPGILYGLPKIHKEGTPMRPILSAIGTSGYKLSKFIIKFLTPLSSNEFTLKDSFTFVNEICAIPNDQNYTMASFDVKSLFTNIPINETINIACDTLFDPDRQFDTIFTKNYFKQLLELATKGIIFLFNNNLYSQEDGVAMGSPLAPTFANLFLCHQ